jgi:hypothetical protein
LPVSMMIFLPPISRSTDTGFTIFTCFQTLENRGGAQNGTGWLVKRQNG